jgi:hypothetical protein
MGNLEQRQDEDDLKRIRIELVPATMWGKSLASLARSNPSWWSKWQEIRRREISRTAGLCEICGINGVIVHEKWDYGEDEHIQRLNGFEVTCENCSLVHHIGRASVTGGEEQAIEHLKKVNSLSDDEAEALVEKAFRTWNWRSQFKWNLDLTWLRMRRSDYGLSEKYVDEAESLLQTLEWHGR